MYGRPGRLTQFWELPQRKFDGDGHAETLRIGGLAALDPLGDIDPTDSALGIDEGTATVAWEELGICEDIVPVDPRHRAPDDEAERRSRQHVAQVVAGAGDGDDENISFAESKEIEKINAPLT